MRVGFTDEISPFGNLYMIFRGIFVPGKIFLLIKSTTILARSVYVFPGKVTDHSVSSHYFNVYIYICVQSYLI